MITLKNGTQVKDPRLTRIVHFDERSRQFPVKTTISSSAKPRSYTWACDVHLDQLTDGSCVGHSWSHELIAKPAVFKNGVDHNFATNLYYEAQKVDDWAGGEYPGASPTYSGTSVLAGAKVVKSLGYMKEYRWAFGLDDLIMAVGHKGPAVLGINWYEDMFHPDETGVIAATGPFVGGHAILCKGVNIKDQYFILHNSWGVNWGINGDCKVYFEEMDFLLHQEGEACIPMVRNSVITFKSIIDAVKGMFS